MQKKFKVSLQAFFWKCKKDLSHVLYLKLLMSIINNHGDEGIVKDPHQDFGFKKVMDTKGKLVWTSLKKHIKILYFFNVML